MGADAGLCTSTAVTLERRTRRNPEHKEYKGSLAASAGRGDARSSRYFVAGSRADLLTGTALSGRKLRGLAFAAALVGAPGIFGASPALAQCASGLAGSDPLTGTLILAQCNATSGAAPTSTAVGA